MIEDNYQASTNYVLKIGKFYYRQIVSYKQKEERKKIYTKFNITVLCHRSYSWAPLSLHEEEPFIHIRNKNAVTPSILNTLQMGLARPFPDLAHTYLFFPQTF